VTVREWALVAFTLLMQTSVGVLLVVTALHPFVTRGTAHAPVRAFELPLLVAGAGAALALVVSLAHLGQPLHAWLAVANVRTSWLSREIVLALLFTGAVVSVAALFRMESSSAAARLTVSVLAIALGVAAVYVMSRLYMVPAQPAWNRVATPLAFFATTLVLGTLVVLLTMSSPGLAALNAVEGKAATSGLVDESAALFVRVLVLVALGLLAVQLLLLPAQLATLSGEPAAAISAASSAHLAAWLAATRAILAIAAGVVLATMLRAIPGPLPVSSASTALVLACISEICGRVLFYASSVRL
jgi:anaerobic dimethyl sulfoxide reductase subunit C (anchor subunit)